MRGMLRHRPHASNVAVVSLLRNKKGGKILINKKKIINKKKPTSGSSELKNSLR
jgi:hypothetical protein